MESSEIKSKKTESQSGAVPSRMRKRYELLDECREMILSRLGDALQEAVKNLGDKLTDAASKSKDSNEQEVLLQAAQVVKQYNQEIHSKFKSTFKDVFEKRLFAVGQEEQKAPEPSLDELSLVSDEDITSRLAVDRLVHRSKARLNPDEVLGMRARLGVLLDRDWFDEDKQPASPSDVFAALKTVLQELSPSPSVAAALLEALEPYMSSNLNEAYNRVNRRLVAQQILPRVRPTVRRSPVNLRQPRQPGESGYDQQQGMVDGQGVPVGSQGVPVGSMDPMFMSASAFSGLMDGLHRGVPMARQQTVRMLTDETSFGLVDLPFPEAPEALLQAVGHLQASLLESPMSGRQRLGELKEQVSEKGSALDKLTVDIVELVFDYIYSDHRLTDAIKQRLLRLQVVAVKSALLDRSFFAKRQHPLRQVLDQITELGSDPEVDPDPNSQLVQDIDKVVTKIVKEFESDLAVFETALDELALITEREEERRRQWLEQKTAESVIEEQRVEAMDEYRRVLAQRVDSHAPEFIREFLLRWWSSVLAEAKVNPAAPLDEARAMQLADTLLWSAAPKSADEIPKMAGLLPQLINGLIKGLNLVECPQAEREAFFNELLKVHTRAIDSARSSSSAGGTKNSGAAPRAISHFVMAPDGQIKFNAPASTDTSPAAAPTVTSRDELVDLVFKGQQLDIVEENGEVNRYKLSWISPSKKLYLLSRYPHQPLSVSRADFTAWLESAKARVIEEDNVIGKAIGAAANSATKFSVPVAA